MSHNAVIAFFQAAEDDADLQERLEALASTAQLVRLARLEGYAFSESEALDVFTGREPQPGGELSQQALDAVVGGIAVVHGEAWRDYAWNGYSWRAPGARGRR